MIKRRRAVIDRKSTCHKTFFGGKGLIECSICIDVLGCFRKRDLVIARRTQTAGRTVKKRLLISSLLFFFKFSDNASFSNIDVLWY